MLNSHINPLTSSFISFAEVAAAEILTFDGFIKDIERDKGHRREDGETISEVQGSPQFCEKVSEIVKKIPHALSPYNLRKNKEINEKLFCILNWKRFAHVFSLKGKVPLPDSSPLNLEGFNDPFSMTMLMSSFDDFAKFNVDLVSPEMRQWIFKAFSNALWHDNATVENIEQLHKNIHDPSYSAPLVIGTGWDWHSVIIIFYKNYFIYCNRGAGTTLGQSGWEIHKIGSKEPITLQFIENLIKRLSITKDNYISLKDIVSKLDSKKISYCGMKQQKVGNCTYLSVKASILAILTLWECQKDPTSLKKLDNNLIAKAEATAITTYKAFTDYERREIFDDFLIDVETYNILEDDVSSRKYQYEGIQKIWEIFCKKIHKSKAFTLGFQIGWERWNRFDKLAKNEFEFFPDRAALNCFANLVDLKTCQVNFNEFIGSIAELMETISSHSLITDMIKNLQKIRRPPLTERLKIFQLLQQRKLDNSMLRENFYQLEFILDIKRCESFEKRLELTKQIFSLGTWVTLEVDDNYSLDALGFIDDINQCKTSEKRFELLKQISELGRWMQIKLRGYFDRLGFIEDIKKCENSNQKLELSKKINLILDNWSYGLFSRISLEDLGFIDEIAKCDNPETRIELIKQIISSGSGTKIFELLAPYLLKIGIVEDIQKCETFDKRFELTKQILLLGDWVVDGCRPPRRLCDVPLKELGFINDIMQCQTLEMRFERTKQIASLGYWTIEWLRKCFLELQLDAVVCEFCLTIADRFPVQAMEIFLPCIANGRIIFNDNLEAFTQLLEILELKDGFSWAIAKRYRGLRQVPFTQRIKICSLLQAKDPDALDLLKTNFIPLGFINDIAQSENHEKKLALIREISLLGDWAMQIVVNHFKDSGLINNKGNMTNDSNSLL